MPATICCPRSTVEAADGTLYLLDAGNQVLRGWDGARRLVLDVNVPVGTALSGGVDSAVTATLAARALGAENVLAVRMPYRTSSPDSLTHAQLVIDQLGIPSRTIDISGTPVVALVVPHFASVEAKAREADLTFHGPAEMTAHPWVRQLIEGEVARLTAHLAQYEKIKRFALLDHEGRLLRLLLGNLLLLDRGRVLC